MIKLTKILESIITEKDYPKNKFVKVNNKKDLQVISKQIYDLINNAYSKIGGHLKIRSPKDVLDPSLNYWVVADTDSDPDIDAVYFGKDQGKNIKHTGIGHDGEKSTIKKVLTQKTKELKKSGHYIEVSGGAFKAFVMIGNVPTIDDEMVVKRLLKGKNITWYGKHPKKNLPGDGWYGRTIGGKEIIKIIAGVPN